MMSTVIISWCVVILLVITSPSQSRKVPSPEEYAGKEESCADILDISDDLRAQIRQQQYPDTPESHRLVYCTAVLFFEYKPTVGLDMDLMFGIFGQPGDDRAQFGEEKKRCFKRNGANKVGLSRFESVYRMHQCFANPSVMAE